MSGMHAKTEVPETVYQTSVGPIFARGIRLPLTEHRSMLVFYGSWKPEGMPVGYLVMTANEPVLTQYQAEKLAKKMVENVGDIDVSTQVPQPEP